MNWRCACRGGAVVQAVYKFDDRRIVAGRIETGRIAVGDEIVVMPSGKTARVRSIESWPVPEPAHAPRAAGAGQSIGITLDSEIFLDRGDVVSTAAVRPKAAQHCARECSGCTKSRSRSAPPSM